VELTLAQLQEAGAEGLPGLLGIEIREAGDGQAHARLELGEQHHAPNGYLHAGAVVALADSRLRLRLHPEPAGRSNGVHDDRTEDELPSQRPRGHDRVRRPAHARRPHDADLGCNRLRSGWPADGPISLHPAPAPLAARTDV
jgi:hypothetical protein